MNSGIDLKDLTKKLENIDIKQVMDKMKIEIKLNKIEKLNYTWQET